MKTILLTITIIAVASAPSLALNVSVPGYTVETYATYTDSVRGIPRHMTFDANGNLYVTQQDSGTVWKITPSRVASQFTDGFTAPYSIVFGGGTPYGDYLYVGHEGVTKVDLSGNKTFFANQRCNGSMTIDRTGDYGGFLYLGDGCADDIEKINTVGSVTIFSTWPGYASGGPYGIDFDLGTAYGGLMYIGSEYGQSNAYKSGLFSMSTGGTATRFSSNLVQVWDVDFDKTGLFAGLLFVIGRTSFSGPAFIYSVGVDGIATEFAASTMLNGHGMAFGPDGAMYISEYAQGGLITISRIAPVPPPAPPVADADGPYTIYEGDILTLDASGSTDDDNDIVSYMWDLDDDGIFETDAGNQPVFDVEYDYLQSLGLLADNTYTIHLMVTDSNDLNDINDTALTILYTPALRVYVDIKPGSCPNPLNVKNKGVLPAAVLGTNDFDVMTIDPESVRLAGVEPMRFAYEDVVAPVTDANECNCTTAGPDGFLDLTLKFDTQSIVEAIGSVSEGEELILELTGNLISSEPYEIYIEGADCIWIRGKK